MPRGPIRHRRPAWFYRGRETEGRDYEDGQSLSAIHWALTWASENDAGDESVPCAVKEALDGQATDI
jgi:hypothetical protein